MRWWGLTAPPANQGKATDPRGDTFYGASNFWVEDLSSNGTFVNQVRVGRGKRFRLCNNDVVALCKNENKKGTKGTKFTYIFTIVVGGRPPNVLAYPLELLSRYDIRETLGTVRVIVGGGVADLTRCAGRVLRGQAGH